MNKEEMNNVSRATYKWLMTHCQPFKETINDDCYELKSRLGKWSPEDRLLKLFLLKKAIMSKDKEGGLSAYELNEFVVVFDILLVCGIEMCVSASGKTAKIVPKYHWQDDAAVTWNDEFHVILDLLGEQIPGAYSWLINALKELPHDCGLREVQ